MDKLQHLPIFLKLKDLLHSDRQAMVVSVDLVWRLVLGTTILLATLLVVLAWFAYGWAVKEDVLPFSRTSRDAFSIEELRGVIETYQKKETDHATLRRARPAAPSLGVGVSISAGVEN